MKSGKGGLLQSMLAVLLSAVLVTGMVSNAAPMTVLAEEASESGTCGDNLTWTLADGVLTISGSGAMEDYTSDTTPFKRSDIKSVVINEGVTRIGNYAFYNCSGLAKVTIADSVKSIGDYAFFECGGITDIKIPANMEIIGEGAFRGCRGLTGITIPASVTSIGDCAFYECTKLKTVTMQGNPPALDGKWVFGDCEFKRYENLGIHVPKGKAQDY